MKTCSSCGATYEDEVEFCFVDGEELTFDAGPPSSGSVIAPPGMLATPAPAPTAQAFAPAAEPSPAPPPAPAPAPAGRSTIVVAALALVLVLLLLLVVGGALAMFSVTSAPVVPVAAPVVEMPVPAAPVPAPPPAPVAAPAPTVRMVDVTSDPDGSEVWEGNTLLGVTPCKVEQPEHAPIPRTFTVKLAGYLDTTIEMTDPKVPLRATLTKLPPASPRPRPAAPAPTEGILIER